MYKIHTGNCTEILQQFPGDFFHSVVTDPPYELGFMGRDWDKAGVSFQPETWAEVLRVMKPGGHLLAFGGSRTYHRIAVAIEDAGFEIRDTIMWLYGQGFPKNHDVSKAIDKAAGAKREVVGVRQYAGGHIQRSSPDKLAPPIGTFVRSQDERLETAPATPEAQQWSGWGTALKPSFEPIILARKPFKGTVANNVLEHGTGAINIDGCRIGNTKEVPASVSKHAARANGVYDGNRDGSWGNETADYSGHNPNIGRWPANVILDEEAGRLLDEQTGTLASGKVAKDGMHRQNGDENRSVYGEYGGQEDKAPAIYGDSGGASRFFYCAKASKKERGEGNNHPTVKPLALMRYLVRLITPPEGYVLDPFSGSGTTLLAAIAEGFHPVGIEMNPEYVEIAERRIRERATDG